MARKSAQVPAGLVNARTSLYRLGAPPFAFRGGFAVGFEIRGGI